MPLSGVPLQGPVVVADLLARGLALKPDEPALVSTATQWSWRELEAVSYRLAANFLAIGLKPGDRVASLMPNRVELVVHYLACLRAGLVAMPLNYRYTPPEIDYALEVGGASILLAHQERDADLALSDRAENLPKGVIRYADADRPLPEGPNLASLMATPPPNVVLPIPRPDAPAMILFTSGSTGKPKGVTHTHRSLGYILASTVASFRLGPDDIVLPGLSISHIAGIGYSLSALAAGGRVDVARKYVDEELLQLLRKTRPTAIVMLPASLFRLIEDPDTTAGDFRSLRLCIVGGDKITNVLEDEFRALTGLQITTNYGMTEIGFTTMCPLGETRPGSIGRPLAGFSLSIRDEHGAELPAGREGRLWVTSNTVMAGYWDNPQATAEAIVDGWLDTGDIVSADDDGYLRFTGRKKQIIIHDGSNISPQEIEETLQAHVTVADVGVVGVRDLVHGENVRAYVTLKPGATRPPEQELIAFARARVGYKAPEEIVFLDELPLNAVGKVDRIRLKEMAAQTLHR